MNLHLSLSGAGVVAITTTTTISPNTTMIIREISDPDTPTKIATEIRTKNDQGKKVEAAITEAAVVTVSTEKSGLQEASQEVSGALTIGEVTLTETAMSDKMTTTEQERLHFAATEAVVIEEVSDLFEHSNSGFAPLCENTTSILNNYTSLFSWGFGVLGRK